MSFAHLHLHTQYSLLDGFANIKKLMQRVKELEMPAVAITDHGTMFGVIEFYKEARAAGIKPIIGLEAYLSPRRMQDKDAKLDRQAYHLLLLAENETGYKNLLRIASAAQLEGFYYNPRIDRDFLAAHSEGLICTSGCMAAEVPRTLADKGPEAAAKKLDWYYEVFGPDRFFIELQQHNIPELQVLNETLLQFGKRYQSRFVATNDVHYINPSDARLQDILLSIQTGSLLSQKDRFRMSDTSYYLRTPQEMAQLFSHIPEALSNTLLIADRCNVDLIKKGYHLPLFEVPEGENAQTYLRNLCEEGLLQRYGSRAADQDVRERLEYELKVINEMGFAAYFLIVWDLCRQARELGIWYNTRGSGAASIVAYSLNITLVEPLEQKLIFERFLNPGRISMPDIDLDFQDDRRGEIMQYCAQKYGDDRVAQIITFGTMAARGALRDVGRVMDIPLGEVDRVAKLIPFSAKGASIEDALKQVPELKDLYDNVPYLHELIETASKMEGSVRNAGTHAAGVVITDLPIIEYAPIHRPTNGAEDSPIKTVIQFEMNVIEVLGLLKVDFLGLSTLTVMQRACDLIEARHGVRFTLNNIPTGDPETFEFLSRGHTAGVFQIEGSGMTRYIMQMKPRNLANIIAMVALYRPGPLEFIPSYIKRMHGEEDVTYRHPKMEPIFRETYGIPIYQEQIMFAAIDLAGYTASESDELRKAISKKKADAVAQHRIKFVAGAVERGMDQETAEAIFTDWEKFANYGFNKSHAADYGVIAIQTGYLKYHYPHEYMTALLSASKNDTAKVAFYVADCRAMGIEVLAPDVNKSCWDFGIEDRPEQEPAIRFGLGAVKNVGSAPVEMICAARADGGPFRDLNDFARRVDLRQVGKRSLECLIRVGALDSFGPRRSLLNALDSILSISASHFRALQSGQMSFFGSIAGVEETITLPIVPDLDPRELLEWERELLGLYVSAHPLTPYMSVLQRKVTHYSAQLAEARDKDKVCVAGMVSRIRTIVTKNGKPMGFVTLEDIQGYIELVLFPKTWESFGKNLQPDKVISVVGKVDLGNGGDPKVLADSITVETPADLPPEGGAEWLPNSLPEPAAGFSSPVASDDEETPARQEYDDDLPPMPEMPDDWHLSALPVETAPAPAVKTPAVRPADLPLAVKPAPAPAPAIVPPAAPPPVSVEAPHSLAEKSGAFTSLPPYILPPSRQVKDSDDARMVTVVLRASDDCERDVRRMRRIYNWLSSTPGKDRFAFLIFEHGHQYLMEFPNTTTGINTELLHKLITAVGEENVRVETITLQ